MRRKIPSTGALLAFEVAARHGSFSRAAEELYMTEGAVSRQIARLEEFLGVELFARVKSRVHLTEAGRIYWEQVAEHLRRIEQDTLNLIGRPECGVLELAVIPTFTNKWIMPRLCRFHDKNPGITINMTERHEPFLMSESPFDAAIHYDHPAWASMTKKDLFAEELVPVCAPRLLPSAAPWSPNALLDIPLLHKRSRAEAWKRWWDKIGVEHPNPASGARYDLFSMIIEAARAGLGLALVPRLYVLDEVKAGTLVIPVDSVAIDDKKYCIVYPQRMHGQWPLDIFLNWLEEEVQLYLIERTTSM